MATPAKHLNVPVRVLAREFKRLHMVYVHCAGEGERAPRIDHARSLGS
jgi:hypothetical protein